MRNLLTRNVLYSAKVIGCQSGFHNEADINKKEKIGPTGGETHKNMEKDVW